MFAAAICVVVAFVVGASARITTSGVCGAETDPATDVTTTSATLNGKLGAESGSDAMECDQWFFDYGPTIAYGSTTPLGSPSEGGEIPVSTAVTGLTPDTTYHFRLHATDGLDNLGGDLTFHTAAVPPPPPKAVLDIAKSVSPSTVTTGSNVVFSIVVMNHGPPAATNVTVTDTLPAGLSFISDSSPNGTCTGTTTITCSLGTLANGENGTVAITARTSTTGSATDTATVNASNIDPSSHTSSSATFTVVPPPGEAPPTAALGLSNAVNPATTSAGTNVTFTIVVTDNGPADANDVGVTDTLPAGLSFGSASSSSGSCTGTTTVTCTLGTIANGAKATVTLVAVTSTPGAFTDTATATASNRDSSSQPSASATVSVTAPPATTTATTTTASTPSFPPGVVLDSSIGPVSIGESEQRVLDALGPPLSTLTIELPGGKRGKLARYHLHGALFLITYDATGHVVSIETYSSYYRTASGLGPGSSLALVAKLLGFRLDFCELGYWDGSAQTRPADVVTVFTPNGGLVASVLITQLRLYTACASEGREFAPEVTLALDRSIGGVSIGMTEAEVRALLGAPASTLKITLGGGKTGRSVRYVVHGAPLLLTYDSSGRVASIEAYSSFFRTAGGIGPGSPLELVLGLPGFRPDFCELGYWNGTAATPPSHVITVFTPEGALVASVLITQLRLYTACDTGSTELPPAA
jgi:uncharacterized repeat protein (TIGR01451 family)